MRAPDWIRLLEASYELDGDGEAWRHRLLEHAAPLFQRRSSLVLFTARVTPSRVELESADVLGPAGSRETAVAVNDAGPPEAIDTMYRGGAVVGSISELVFARVPGSRERFAAASGGAVTDGMAVVGRAGAGRTAIFIAARRETVSSTPEARRRWHLAMSHVCAGMRLRRAFPGPGVEGPAREATLDPAGRVCAAEGPARSPSAREALRDAVRRIERTRTAAGRRDPDAAMERWRGLVEGRWSLVDQFDSDGKRHVVAVRNDPDVLDPRGLSRREQQVAEAVGLGRSTKEIAYELGLSLSAVSMSVGSARRKLGLRSRAELAAFFAPGGIRARLVEAALEGESLLVGTHRFLDEAATAKLSAAEQDVAVALVSGSTSGDVAGRRGTSERTVANQIASIFDKLGVRSRIELAARLQAPAPRAAAGP